MIRTSMVLALLVCLPACLVVVPVPVMSPADAGRASAPVAVVTSGFGGALNDLRRTEGLAGLGQDPALTRAADAHAAHMAQAGYFSHASPGGPNGDTMAQRIRTAGCMPRAMAENIARGQRTETEVLSAWAASPGHRANMLGPRYRTYGLGRSGDVWVLLFADGC